MFCPVCGSEYRPGFYTCVDCEVPLVDQPPARAAPADVSADDPDMVKVCQAADAELLVAAVTRLRHADIVHTWGAFEGPPAGDATGVSFGPDPYLEPGEVRVRAADAAEARLWLANLKESVAADRDELAHYGLGDRNGLARDLVYCPRCGISQAARLGACVDCGGPTVAKLPRDWRQPEEVVFMTRRVDLLAAARQALAEAGIRHSWGPLGHLPFDPAVRASDSVPDYGSQPGQMRVKPAEAAAEARRILALAPELGPAVIQAAAAPTAAAPAEAAGGRLAPWRDRHDPEAAARSDRPTRAAPGGSFPGAGRREPGVVFCPVCRSEYRTGTATCVDCGAALVEELPPEAEDESGEAGDWEDEDQEDTSGEAEEPEDWGDEESEEEADGPEGRHHDDHRDRHGEDDRHAAPGDERERDEDDESGENDEDDEPRGGRGGRHGIVLPGDAAAIRLAEDSYRAARALAVSSILLPWIVAPLAWRRAERALEGYRRSGLQAPGLETAIRRVRFFAAVLACGSWAAVLYYLWSLPAW